MDERTKTLTGRINAIFPEPTGRKLILEQGEKGEKIVYFPGKDSNMERGKIFSGSYYLSTNVIDLRRGYSII